MSATIRIGTRGSDLALWQARHVAGRLEAAGARCEIIVLVTRGDRIDDVPLQSVEGKGFFTKELEEALLSRRVDLAVHSHKDLPSETPAGLAIAAVPERAAPEERLLVAPAAHEAGALFLPLRRGARVGTSAPRRTAQLTALRPDLVLESLRGNVPTRVRKLREGRYDAIVLAAAGLDRLGLDVAGLEVVTMPRERFVPAPGQGALAIQTRADDAALRELCARALHDDLAARTVVCERELLTRLGGGCNLPLGVTLVRTGASWTAHAFLGAGHPRPESPARWCRASGNDPESASAAIGERLLEGRTTGDGPLAGLRVALAGSRDSGTELAARLTTLGAEVRREELIEVEDLDAPTLPSRLAGLRPGDAVAVTSANAARRLHGARIPSGVRLAAVGRATAHALAEAGHAADVIGDAGGRELARALELPAGARVLFPCAEGARPGLEEELAARGIAVERLPLYRTRARPDARLDAEAEVRLYLSPSAAAAGSGLERARPVSARRVALGAATAEALVAAGLDHTVAAGTAPEDVLEALLRLPVEKESHR